MDLLQAMKISGTALTAQRSKLNVISENLANNETTHALIASACTFATNWIVALPAWMGIRLTGGSR